MQLTFRQKEHLFHQLGQLVRSGETFRNAVEVLGRHGFGKINRVSRKLLKRWQQGGSAAEAFSLTGFELRDIAIVEAGEDSGRLPDVFFQLSSYYKQLADAQRTLIMQSLYPIFILHFGVLCLALPSFFIGGSKAFWNNIWPILGGFYILLILIFICAFAFLWLARRNSLFAWFFSSIPILGGIYRDWTSWNFATVLSLYLQAGGSFLRAFSASADASGNAAMRHDMVRIVHDVQNGHTLSESFRRRWAFPSALVRAIEVGDRAGRLPEETHRMAEYYRVRIDTTLTLLSVWLPRILYVGILILTAFMVISMARGVGTAFMDIINNGSL